MKKGEVWNVSLPDGIGHEQKGTRPAIVVAKANKLVVIVPLTKNFDRNTLLFTLPIEQTPENGLSFESIALVFQISAKDESRFKEKLGEISQEKQDLLNEILFDFFKLKK